RGAQKADIQAASEILNPEILTIGFARRFATYNRGDLI
ncbi:MAG: Carbohydrate phosphorylase, partial [Deltaproteobacteria bacterium]|nr:Carbohydrate phosphorylase [Deltaproteobacteria bacterium]